MQTPAGAFNSHVDSQQIWKNSLITRMYGEYNNRGPFLYPESPYALGDIAPLPSMAPIGFDTLFSDLPSSSSQIASSTAPIGSAGFPTFQAQAPDTQGTVLGPAGATIPEVGLPTSSDPNPPATNGGTGSGLTAGQQSVSYSSPYFQGSDDPWSEPGKWAPANRWYAGKAPAATLQEAAAKGNAGPITFNNPFPTMIQPAPQEFAQQAAPSFMCQVGSFVQQNPLLAAAGVAALYFALKKGRK